MSVTPSPEAVRVAARVRMAEDECSYPITVHPSACVCDVHGTPFEGMEVGDLYGHLSYMGGICTYVKEHTTAALTAAAPIIAAQAKAEALREAADALESAYPNSLTRFNEGYRAAAEVLRARAATLQEEA